MVPAALIVIALVLRSAAVLSDTGYRPTNDAFDYDRHARSIAGGDGFPPSGYLIEPGPSALRPPGYPFFLGGVYALSGDSKTAGRFANVALGALAVLLTFLIARSIWGRRVALVGAGLVAVFPPLVLLSRDLLSESLFLSLELAAVFCVVAFRRSGAALRFAAAAGALCGLAALTRNPGAILVLPMALGVWTLRPALRPRALLPPALVVLCAALVILPWTLRNAVEFGRFVPVSTGSGFALAGTYSGVSLNDHSNAAAWRTPQAVPEYAPLFLTPGIDEATLDATLRREALSFASGHPGYVAEAVGVNLLRMFEFLGGSVVTLAGHPLEQRGIGSADPPVEQFALVPAVLLALAGMLAIARARRPARESGGRRFARGPVFLWLVPILTVLSAAPVAGLPRYRVPADPFLLILGAIAIVWAWEGLEGRRGQFR